VKKVVTVSITSPIAGTWVCGHNTITFNSDDLINSTCQASINGISWVSFTSNSTTLSAVPGFSSVACNSDFTLYLRDWEGCNQLVVSSIRKASQ